MSKPTLLKEGSLKIYTDTDVSDIVPIDYITTWLRQHMPEYGCKTARLDDRILILLAETGSGKSTILPVNVFRILRSPHTSRATKFIGPCVICTQPRVLTAIALASDVDVRHSPWNNDMILEETVGYQTGPTTSKGTGLIYATSGVLSNQLRNHTDNEIMDKYRFIIVDEAHERSLENDMTLMLIRNFYFRNIGNIKLPFLILASATIITSRYSDYFSVTQKNIIEVTGRAFQINTHWLQSPTNDYPVEAAKTALSIHKNNIKDDPLAADILIFMPGMAESTAVSVVLRKALQDEALKYGSYLVLMINREVVISQSGDYTLVFTKPHKLPQVEGKQPIRRIIISTVVAETGLTIDTLKYVIDCGWNRTKEVYQPYGAEGIISRPAPQSRIKQRKGRVGRLFNGEFYPMYTHSVYESLDIQQLPDIITTGPKEIFLSIIREQQRQKILLNVKPEFLVQDMTLLDLPPLEAFIYSNSLSTMLGFISLSTPMPVEWPVNVFTLNDINKYTQFGCGLTAMGHIAAQFVRTPIEGIRMILAGYMWGVAASDLITAAAMFGVKITDLYIGRGRKSTGNPYESLPFGATSLKESLPNFILEKIGGKKSKSFKDFKNSKDFKGSKDSTDEVTDEVSDKVSDEIADKIDKTDEDRDGEFEDEETSSLKPITKIITSVPNKAHKKNDKTSASDKKSDKRLFDKKISDKKVIPPKDDEEFYFRAKILLADDFAEAILLFDKFAEKLIDLSSVIIWCKKTGLNFDAMLELSRRRELIIEDLLNLNMNPFRLSNHKLSNLTIDNFMDGLCKLKRCIYDGLRCKLLTWHPDKFVYMTEQGLRVRAPSLFSEATASRLKALRITSDSYSWKANWIVTDSIKLTQAYKKDDDAGLPLLYTVEANLISVMDGYVYPDIDFTKCRQF